MLFGAPWRMSYNRSMHCSIVSMLRWETMAVSVHPVPASLMTRIVRSVPRMYSNVKSSCIYSLNASLTWVSDILWEGSGLPFCTQIKHELLTRSMACDRRALRISARLHTFLISAGTACVRQWTCFANTRGARLVRWLSLDISDVTHAPV